MSSIEIWLLNWFFWNKVKAFNLLQITGNAISGKWCCWMVQSGVSWKGFYCKTYITVCVFWCRPFPPTSWSTCPSWFAKGLRNTFIGDTSSSNLHTTLWPLSVKYCFIGMRLFRRCVRMAKCGALQNLQNLGSAWMHIKKKYFIISITHGFVIKIHKWKVDNV